MDRFLESVRTFFAERNQAWLTGNTDAIVRVSRASGRESDLRNVNRTIKLKRREVQSREGKLLRAHSQIRCKPIRKARDKGSQSIRTIQLDERITWVIEDGKDYVVECRIIHHTHRWRKADEGFVLEDASESYEPTWDQPIDISDESRNIVVLPSRSPDSEAVDPQGTACIGYDRVRAHRYSELWWDGANPRFVRFSNDCTNFVSQSLLAGGLPMNGGQSRESGWWYRNLSATEEATADAAQVAKWSYSWSVSHALFGYLTRYLQAPLIKHARDLKIGDLIFYDWDGTGRFHHTAMVADFDSRGEPLVNAHTDDSYHRHYLYRDSRAWTRRTRYAYVHLPDSIC